MKLNEDEIDLVLWMFDATDWEIATEDCSWLHRPAPKYLSDFAHKIHCWRRYRGQRKQIKAIRRFWRQAMLNEPELLLEAIIKTKSLLSEDVRS